MSHLILPAELLVREFWGRVLVALSAAESGVASIVGERDAIRGVMPYLNPGVMLLKAAQPHYLDWMHERRQEGHRLCVQDEEALVAHSRDNFASYRFSQETIDACEEVYCWGEIDRVPLLKAYPADEAKIISTGNPRFDLWREPLCGVHQSKVDELRARYGDFLLVPSNFTGLFHGDGQNFALQQARKMKVAATEQQDDEYIRLQEHVEQCRVEFVELMVELARDHKVVLRPHPSENVQRWKDQFGPGTDIEVVHEGTIAPWIMASRAVVHHGCSTGLEATILGVPSIAYLPFYDPTHDNHISLTFSSQAEKREAVFQLLGSSEASRTQVEMEAGRLLGLEPTPAFDRLAGRLVALCDPCATRELVRDTARGFRVRRELEATKSEVNRLQAKVRRLKDRRTIAGKLRRLRDKLEPAAGGDDRPAPNHVRQGRIPKWRKVELQEIQEFAAVTGQLLGRFDGIELSQVEENVFIVGPK